MDVEECHGLREIPAEGAPVVNVHEFRGDEPYCKALIRHPIVRQEHEIAIESRKAADFYVERFCKPRFKPTLVVKR
jgi:hypothetical protein